MNLRRAASIAACMFAVTAGPAAARFGEQVLSEARLADAGLASDEHDAALPGQRDVEMADQFCALGIAPDHRPTLFL